LSFGRSFGGENVRAISSIAVLWKTPPMSWLWSSMNNIPPRSTSFPRVATLGFAETEWEMAGQVNQRILEHRLRRERHDRARRRHRDRCVARDRIDDVRG